MILAWHGLPLISTAPVFATGRFAEGTAVVFNRKKKGQKKLLSAVLHIGADRQHSTFGIVPGNA